MTIRSLSVSSLFFLSSFLTFNSAAIADQRTTPETQALAVQQAKIRSDICINDKKSSDKKKIECLKQLVLDRSLELGKQIDDTYKAYQNTQNKLKEEKLVVDRLIEVNEQRTLAFLSARSQRNQCLMKDINTINADQIQKTISQCESNSLALVSKTTSAQTVPSLKQVLEQFVNQQQGLLIDGGIIIGDEITLTLQENTNTVALSEQLEKLSVVSIECNSENFQIQQ